MTPIQQKTLLKNIERAKQEWEITIDALPQLICLLDNNQQIIRANRVVETWSLATVQNVAGKNIHQLFHPNCTDIKCALRIFWLDANQQLAENRSITQEITDPHSDKIFYYQVIPVIPIISDAKNTPAQNRRMVAIISDVTRQKKLEQQLLHSQKMQAIGQLAGGIAHDFNNLLTAIIGYSQFIGDNMPKTSPIYNDIMKIQEAGKRAATLTGQLLAFGRRQLMSPKILNLNNLIFNTEKLLKQLVGENIRLQISATQTLGEIKADPSQIEQVLMNLVVNARDAMPNGGDITLKTDNIIIDENFIRDHSNFSPGHYVRCMIHDTGLGMDRKTIEHIFEPFFTTKKTGNGTGLGLSTVYGIVSQSGGLIDVLSVPGKGTTFTLYFPRTDVTPSKTVPAAETISAKSTASKVTVLIVEDDEMVRSLIGLILARMGYEVFTAEDGDEAITLCESAENPIDFLVTDVIMPGTFNGVQLSEHLKKRYPKLKSIFMSGHMNNVVVQQLTLSPNLPFLQKPFSPHDLLKLIQDLP